MLLLVLDEILGQGAQDGASDRSQETCAIVRWTPLKFR